MDHDVVDSRLREYASHWRAAHATPAPLTRPAQSPRQRWLLPLASAAAVALLVVAGLTFVTREDVRDDNAASPQPTAAGGAPTLHTPPGGPVPSCDAQDLGLHLEDVTDHADDDRRTLKLHLVNKTDTRCALTRAPDISIVDSRGGNAGVSVRYLPGPRDGGYVDDGGGDPELDTIDAHGTLSVGIDWAPPFCPGDGWRLQVKLSGGWYGTMRTPFGAVPAPPCTDPSAPPGVFTVLPFDTATNSACTAADITIRAVARATDDGAIVFDATWSNVSDSACYLTPRLGLHVVDAAGRTLPVRRTSAGAARWMAAENVARGTMVWRSYCGERSRVGRYRLWVELGLGIRERQERVVLDLPPTPPVPPVPTCRAGTPSGTGETLVNVPTVE